MLLDRLIQRFKPLIRFISSRSVSLWMEEIFWARWLKITAIENPDLFRERVDPNEPLSEYHRRFIDFLPHHRIRILDVGAGPLTILGKKHPFKELDIVATDILAEQYAKILAKRNIRPIIKTIYADADNLTAVFPPASFDYVFACNSIDHCANPVRSILEMLAVVKPGCYVTLMHGHNEAEKACYAGLHQWNFDAEGSCFIIWNKSSRLNMTNQLAQLAEVECRVESGFTHAHIRKHA